MKSGISLVLALLLGLVISPWVFADEWPLDSNTIALYHFDDLSDASSNGLDLTLGGNAVLTDENLGWMGNPGGKAVKISDLDDEVTAAIPDSWVLPGASAPPLTFEAWFYPISYRGYGVSNVQILTLYQSWDTSLEVRDGKWNKPRVPTVRAGHTTIVTDDQWDQAVALNQWHFLRITHENGVVSVFIDGQLVSSDSAAFNAGRTNDWLLILGNFEGYVDEVRISNVIRTGPPPVSPAGNQPPVVDTGLDQEIYVDQSVQLQGQATDDGLVNADLHTVWSMTSGPGTVTFGSPNTLQTETGFSETGSYVLRLVADDGEFSVFDEVSITVVERPDPTTTSFSIIILPDTQAYSDYYPEKFISQTQWIADYVGTYNVKTVLHEGDVVNHADDPSEWDIASSAMAILDGVVPYVLNVGNHDYAEGRDSSAFNATFPLSGYETLPTFGGVFEEGKLDNSYHLFSAGGVDFLVLSLEFGPRDEVLAWADSVLSSHPVRRAMILTHAYLSGDGTRLDQGDAHNPHFYSLTGSVNDGEEMWQTLIRKHPNIDFVFSGHVRGVDETGCAHAYSTDMGDHGNLVHQMVANYQDCYDGGDGYLRIITFNPVARSASVFTYSPYLDAYLTDSQNEFVIHGLDFFVQGSMENRPPTVDAGPDQSAFVGEFVSLFGMVGDDGLLYETLDIEWSKTAGPGAAAFEDPSNPGTDVSFSSEGSYTLKLSAFDGEYLAADTVNVNVTTSNAPPVGEDQAVSLQEDGSVEILLTATDPDGDTLVYQIINSPDHGSLSGTPPSLTYDPSKDYFGTDSFTFEVSDGNGGVDTATVAITINPVNDEPAAEDLSFSTVAETPITITLQGTDADDDTLTYRIVNEPQHGTLDQNGSTVAYTPESGFIGSDSFTYVADDGQSESPMATVTIAVGEAGDEFELDETTIALYHFDDLTDTGQSGLDLTMNGNGELTDENLAWMGNPHGKALKISALGDEVTASIPDALLMSESSPSPLTFEARFFPISYQAYGVENAQILTLYQSWDASLEVRDGKWNNPHVPTVRAGQTTVVTDDRWKESVTLNEWHALRVTFDGEQVSVYLDDQLIESAAATVNVSRTTDWVLTLGNFDGYVDEVRISRVVR